MSSFKYIKAFGAEPTIIFIGKIIAIVGQFIGVKMLTTVMSLKSYGELSVALSASTLGVLLIYGPLGQGISRYLSIAIENGQFNFYESAIKKLTFQAITVVVLISLCLISIMYLFVNVAYISIVTFIAILLILDGLNSSIYAGLYNAERKRILAAVIEVFDKFKYLFSFIIIWALNDNIYYALSCFIMTALILLLFNLYNYKNVFSKYRNSSHLINEKKVDYKKSIFVYSSPFAIWGIFTWGQTFSERYILNYFYSGAEVGVYAVINQFGFQTISLGSGLIMQLSAPILFKQASKSYEAAHRLYDSIVFWFILLIIGILFITYLYSKEVIILASSIKYAQYAYYLPWMMLAGCLFSAGQIISMKQMIDIQPKKLIQPKIVSSVIEIILLMIFVKRSSISGVIGSSLVANSIYFIWLIILNKKNRL
ncbi:hypothetical protein HNV11_18230 [Spirosoma taeanense]|uniref:O-antigen/teichoic acid export membrane protein n=1 Tax=Spirosoma taeanense TaxID=2735870 RepID=A0A6M5YCZ8_9BACT|nr:hypothetical protein [Spirosoma taeanense]QJW91176.1 hypothetical protein HNV11_18230 [Spirosoma taeanense]